MHPLPASVIAGYLGGAAKTLAFYPLDTLTTWREIGVRGRPSLRGSYAGCLCSLCAAAPYAALFHTAFWLSEAALASSAAPFALKQCVACLRGG